MIRELPQTWREALSVLSDDPRMAALAAFVDRERAEKVVHPARENVFRAFRSVPFDGVSVVLLGQDPYHGAGQATGLSFSVPEGVRLPPSLRNVFRELASDVGVAPPASGDLSRWAAQGVLLLNAVLTVREGEAGSHAGRGWEVLTDAVIRALSDGRSGVAFLLWGAFAAAKAPLIDAGRHLVLVAPHPSPLSAHRGFFGSRPFSKIDAYRVAGGRAPLDWRLG